MDEFREGLGEGGVKPLNKNLIHFHCALHAATKTGYYRG